MIAPKLRFSEFKDEWKKEPLGKVVNFSNGKRIPLSEAERKIRQGEYRYYGASGVIDYIDDYIFDGQYILIGEDGANILNRSSPLAFVVNGKFWVNNHAHIFQSKLGNNLFLATYLESLNYEKHNSGTAQPKLNLENLKKIEVANPSTQEQTKIAEFLSAVDDKISQLSRQLELLNQYKKGVMQKIFSQEIRFKNDNGEDFGEWEEIQLKDFLTLTLRPVDKPNENYHALGVRSHFKGLFNKYDSQPEKNSMDVLYEVFENDIVVNITFAWEGAMAIANKIHHKGLVSHRFPTYQTDESKILLNFFRYIFIQKDFLAELQLCSPGGAGRNRVLSKKDFLEISILKPSVQEQAKIAEFLTAIDERIDHTTAQLTHTKQWKKGLLQQMFV